MRNYIFVYFLPGACGNFLCRSINLLNGTYFYLRADGSIPQTLDEKLEILNYEKVKDYQNKNLNWFTWEFENKIEFLPNINHTSLPNNSSIILSKHPTKETIKLQEILAGQDDRVFLFYVDIDQDFEWVFLNSIHKSSYWTEEWLVNYSEIKNDPRYFKISLKNIITSVDTFIEEFNLICNHMNVTPTQHELSAVRILYDQWKSTTIDYEKCDEYKQLLGLPKKLFCK